jgi:AcrR family transcriptional regulator
MGTTRKKRAQRSEFTTKKRPRQRRAKETFDAIAVACARLLVRHGYERVTTNHIADEAGVAIGSLYEYFPGKDAIVALVAERLVDRVVAKLAAAVPEVLALPPERAVRQWIEVIYQTLLHEKRLVGVFVHQVPYTNKLESIRSIAPMLMQLSVSARESAGARVKLEHERASLYLMINLVSTTIVQLVLDPPGDVSVDEMLTALAKRIDAWLSGG